MLRYHLALIPALLLASACGGSSDEPIGNGPTGGANNGGAPPQTGGTAGDSGEGGTGGTSSTDLVIDDFESGARRWYPFTDVDNGGGSVITTPTDSTTGLAMVGEGYQSDHSFQLDATFDQGELTYPPYIGVAVDVSDIDWASYEAVAYTYKGPTHTMRLETSDVTDYDFHGKKLPAAADWTTVEIRLDELTQEGWGEEVEFNPTNVRSLSFHVQGVTGESLSLVIDDLTAVGTATPLPTTPDLEILPPAPPERRTVSGEVTNPLQAKALQYLDKGANLSDWLEGSRFDGFDYDESYIEDLANAGFKALRLPIDMGLYVEGTDPLELHDDLWLILDSFETWTSTHGLSLTIDWHEYDGSFDADDPDHVALMGEVWGAVAEHFASSSREDLFYELINEPALAAGSNIDSSETGPDRDTLTAFAEAMITAIRAHDTSRTLLFGDYNWSGVDDLSTRETLLSDDNVVYVFHNYDPFIFTHQGTSWTDLGSIHDIPWPYSEERWSEYSREFGFSSSTPSWLLTQLRGYYRVGNQDYLYNRVATAKEWSIEHNVPIVCNEFGPYEGKAQPEDIIHYYTDLVEVFEELEVPWQMWWRAMDEDTREVPEDMAEALGLGE